MKQLIALIALSGAAALSFAQTAAPAAAPADKAPTAQQSRMATCNQEAGDKKGDERKAFMKSCLSGAKADGRAKQQEKMKSCNKEAGDKALKGDERKKFMSECLKG